MIFSTKDRWLNCSWIGDFIILQTFIKVRVQVRFLDKFSWFSLLIFKIEGWYLKGLKKFTIYIFPQSFIKICLLVEVLDRFLYLHVMNLARFYDFFSLMFFLWNWSLVNFFRISIIKLWALFLMDVVILVLILIRD